MWRTGRMSKLKWQFPLFFPYLLVGDKRSCIYNTIKMPHTLTPSVIIVLDPPYLQFIEYLWYLWTDWHDSRKISMRQCVSIASQWHTVTSKVASLPILFKLFVNSKYNMKLNMMHTYRHACIHTYLHTWHRNVISNRLPLVRRGFEPGLLRHSLASRLECLLTKRLRYRGSSHLNSIACPAYDEQAFRPLDTTSKMDLPLALPIYIFVV